MNSAGPHCGVSGIRRVIKGDGSEGKGCWKKRRPSCNEADRD